MVRNCTGAFGKEGTQPKKKKQTVEVFSIDQPQTQAIIFASDFSTQVLHCLLAFAAMYDKSKKMQAVNVSTNKLANLK